MATHVQHSSLGFDEEDFPLQYYDDYPNGLCDLNNENLFPVSKFPMFREKDTPAARNAYALITPALVLISKIIFERWEAYRVFVRRRQLGNADVFLDNDVELELSKEEVLGSIRNALPDIDFDPDMCSDSTLFAETLLYPAAKTDQIIVDYALIKLLKSATASHSQKLAGLFYLAVLIGHGLAHVLEFRSIRGGQLRSDDEAFETPPGVTCGEAGIAWETRALGGMIYPVCEENFLLEIRGLCIKSGAWRFELMKVNDGFIRQLFAEEHWRAGNAQHPLRPPIDKYARYAVLQDELIDEAVRTSTKSKGYETDVKTQSRRPKRIPLRPAPTSTCGGKKVRRDITN